MVFTFLLLACFFDFALGRNSVFTVYSPIDPEYQYHTSSTSTVQVQDLVASVIAAASDATTIEAKCQIRAGQSGDDDSANYIGTWIFGPSTLSCRNSLTNTYLETYECSSLSSYQGTCTDSWSNADSASGTDKASSVTSVGPKDFYPFTFTVTAGAEKLKAAASAPQPSSATQASSASQASNTSQGFGESKTGSAPHQTSNAAVANAVVFGSSLLGVAAGLFGGLL